MKNQVKSFLKNPPNIVCSGQPWPGCLIQSPGRLDGNRQVIVYACQEQKGRKLRLEIFETGAALEAHALQVVTKGKRLKVTEILDRLHLQNRAQVIAYAERMGLTWGENEAVK